MTDTQNDRRSVTAPRWRDLVKIGALVLGIAVGALTMAMLASMGILYLVLWLDDMMLDKIPW